MSLNQFKLVWTDLMITVILIIRIIRRLILVLMMEPYIVVSYLSHFKHYSLGRQSALQQPSPQKGPQAFVNTIYGGGEGLTGTGNAVWRWKENLKHFLNPSFAGLILLVSWNQDLQHALEEFRILIVVDLETEFMARSPQLVHADRRNLEAEAFDRKWSGNMNPVPPEPYWNAGVSVY